MKIKLLDFEITYFNHVQSCFTLFFFRLHFRPKSPVKSEIEEEEVFNVLSSSSLSLVVEDLNEPANELIPVSCVIKYYYILNDVEIST